MVRFSVAMLFALFSLGHAAASDAAEPAQPVAVFQCMLGENEASVTATGDVLTYHLGRPGRAEAMLTGSAASGTIAYHHEMWPHAEDQQLRFRNGATSYVLFNRWAAPSGGAIEQDQSGILVFDGAEQIALLLCSSGEGFLPGYDLPGLPDDGVDVIPDQLVADAVYPAATEDAVPQPMLVGADRDAHGCIGSAGYAWSEARAACVRPWEDGAEPQPAEGDDEGLHEYGLIQSVEDGPYPMYSLMIEFPERGFSQSFSLNAADVDVDQQELAQSAGHYADIEYTSALAPNLFAMTLAGQSVLDAPAARLPAKTYRITGRLSGAGEVTGSDLPGTITVTAEDGAKVDFAYFVPPEMVAANGQTVTAIYTLDTDNWIVSIDIR